MKIFKQKIILFIPSIGVFLVGLVFVFSAFKGEVNFENGVKKKTNGSQTYYLELKGTVRVSIPNEVEEVNPIDSALITVSGYLNQKFYTNKKGKCSLKLPLDKLYKIEVSKKGYVTKFIEVNTIIPLVADCDYGFSFDIDLLENINRLDVSVLKNPIAKILYDKGKGHFEYDVAYTNRINAELKKMYREYYMLQKLQAFRKNEPPLQTVKTDSLKTSIDTTLKSTLPERFRKFDVNTNFRISHAEVIKVIDSFFGGNLQLKVEDIIDLIDFYFEQ